MIAQTKVLLDRIREFIQEKDLEMPVNNANNTVSSFNFVIVIEKGEYSWATNSKKPTVRISNELKNMIGYNVAICGSVGSGKSSLLCNIQGEIPRISGWGIQVYGSKAYVSQSAWIQTGTVRDNMLLGNKMDEELYGSVLCACTLNKDVSNWVNGDLILVREREARS